MSASLQEAACMLVDDVSQRDQRNFLFIETQEPRELLTLRETHETCVLCCMLSTVEAARRHLTPRSWI